MSDETLSSGRVHHAIVTHFIERGRAPSPTEMAAVLGVSLEAASEGLLGLERDHGVVLDPGTGEVWVAHPFSATPTLYWVEQAAHGWWAPCAWCAFGISSLVGDCEISTRMGGNAALRKIAVRGGKPDEGELLAHFTTPIRRAWKNVHRFCATVVLFETDSDVRAWCERHGYEVGSILSLDRVAALAQAWYADHRGADWRKHSQEDAKRIFESVSLSDAFWSVEPSKGRF